MKKNCIVYLVRTSEEDLENLNKSLSLVKENVLPNNPNVDILLFHEDSFIFFKSRVLELPNTIFVPVNFPTPPADAPEIFPHPLPEQVAMGNLGFTMGYRHMCWFFTGGLWEQDIMKEYKYSMRLDTDSYILSPMPALFNQMEAGGYKYAYIEEAIQKDNPLVCVGMWDMCYRDTHNIEEYLMYYTNFEIYENEWFAGGLYYLFFKKIEASGRFYTHRYGDAPLRYLGVNLFMAPQHRLAIKGFIYIHGGTYDLR